MPAFFALGITGFFLCLILTPICRDIFLRAGLVDRPDRDRKFHLRAVPRIGGIPIALAYICALSFFFLFKDSGGKIYIQHGQLLHGLLPAAAVIFFTGLIDDLYGLKSWQKLLGQIVGAVLAVSLGVTLSHLPGWVSIGVSLIWLIGCTNAFNLIDGMDGLATGIGLLATVTTFLVALINGNFGLAMATAPLIGVLLAFLRYNFSPASVFLGDCGSLTIGFILGCFGLIWSQKTGTMVGMIAPLMALALPLVDVGLAIGRRFLRSVPIFKGDRGHIHHMLLGLGFSPRAAALVLYAVCGICASLAVLETVGHNSFGWPILVLFCFLIFVGVRRLGYIEFTAARKTLSHKTMRLAVQEEIQLQELRCALLDANTVDTCWDIVRNACSSLQFATAHLQLNGRSFFENFAESTEEPCCRIQLLLGDRGSLVLTCMFEQTPPRIMMAILIHLQSSMAKKAFEFESSPINITSTAA
jgi:UDP-GlcNAc:undecaprenyl-phosphate/decaprenyl-phosphate GlcNAc-1-phosphate transferase